MRWSKMTDSDEHRWQRSRQTLGDIDKMQRAAETENRDNLWQAAVERDGQKEGGEKEGIGGQGVLVRGAGDGRQPTGSTRV